MKHIIYFLALVSLTTACSCNEPEQLEYDGDKFNYYTITDNPDDSIQHTRYEIFQKYGVPVYLNDTIAKLKGRRNYNGEPLEGYETIDLRWEFDGYRNNKFEFVYLTDPSNQMKALNFVKSFLDYLSPGMRPFSIMLADTLNVTSGAQTKTPIYYNGERTLVLSQVKDLTDESEINTLNREIVTKTLISVIGNDFKTVSKFKEVSDSKHYYDKSFKTLLSKDSKYLKWKNLLGWSFSMNNLFSFLPYSQGKYITPFIKKVTGKYDPLEGKFMTEEDAEALRQDIVLEIGAFGFIRGDKYGTGNTPRTDEEDRNYFIEAMVSLGDDEFLKIYGKAPLVKEKYMILHQYIKDELNVSLTK